MGGTLCCLGAKAGRFGAHLKNGRRGQYNGHLQTGAENLSGQQSEPRLDGCTLILRQKLQAGRYMQIPFSGMHLFDPTQVHIPPLFGEFGLLFFLHRRQRFFFGVLGDLEQFLGIGESTLTEIFRLPSALLWGGNGRVIGRSG